MRVAECTIIAPERHAVAFLRTHSRVPVLGACVLWQVRLVCIWRRNPTKKHLLSIYLFLAIGMALLEGALLSLRGFRQFFPRLSEQSYPFAQGQNMLAQKRFTRSRYDLSAWNNHFCACCGIVPMAGTLFFSSLAAVVI